MYLLFFFLSAFFKGCATVFNFFIDCLESLMKEINISNINKSRYITLMYNTFLFMEQTIFVVFLTQSSVMSSFHLGKGKNTTQVIIQHRVNFLFSIISSPITLERQK